jgi:hypothetical protein
VTVSLSAPSGVEPAMTWYGTLGRNDLPAHLYDSYFDGSLSVPLADALRDAWVSAEYPEQLVDRFMWIGWLQETGFIGEPVTKKSLTLYRASDEDSKDNLAWTSNLEVAEWFQARNVRLGRESTIWVARVPRSCILAHFPDDRNEDEYLVNAEMLNIRAWAEE